MARARRRGSASADARESGGRRPRARRRRSTQSRIWPGHAASAGSNSHGKLGARPDGRCAYRCVGTTIALFPKADGTKAEHTALSFRVDRIEPAVAELQRRGLRSADYDLPGLKTVGHVCVLGLEKAAWFEDPEGNILCLHENLA